MEFICGRRRGAGSLDSDVIFNASLTTLALLSDNPATIPISSASLATYDADIKATSNNKHGEDDGAITGLPTVR
jgi:hypothetical protein